MLYLSPALRNVLIGLILSYPIASNAKDTCKITYDLHTGIVHEQPVSINTDVLWNTTFYPIPEHAVTVTNAPTSFQGITTFRWTELLSYTTKVRSPSLASEAQVASISATPTPAFADSEFVLLVLGDKKNEKRQSGSVYMSAFGTITNDCTTSPIYAITNGVLTATVNGTTYTYSATAGIPYIQFAPTTIPGAITTQFTIGSGGTLTWFNAALYNGQASFCALQNGTVYAVFQENAQPEACLYIQLSLFAASSCQGLVLSSGPSGPTGLVTDRYTNFVPY
ncbi:hypothetical protein PRZ48_004841 [Zasmidium cellare]|uniref:DUF7908 domain-containing protein n=1 Tax=Zasmidium cellare TaxID=395010 RepID=A0ABR0EQN2_ZASCE|nr:hypothetical protein PRZ48_004841 [Zasmidium cellare]